LGLEAGDLFVTGWQKMNTFIYVCAVKSHPVSSASPSLKRTSARVFVTYVNVNVSNGVNRLIRSSHYQK